MYVRWTRSAHESRLGNTFATLGDDPTTPNQDFTNVYNSLPDHGSVALGFVSSDTALDF